MIKTEIKVTISDKLLIAICNQELIYVDDLVTYSVFVSMSRYIGANSVDWKSVITEGMYDLMTATNIKAQGTNSDTGETPIDLISEGIITKLTVSHVDAIASCIDMFRIDIEFGPLEEPILLEDIIIELTYDPPLAFCGIYKETSFCVMANSIIDPIQDIPSAEANCKCITFESATQGSGPHYLYKGSSDIVNIINKPSDIASLVPEVDDTYYQNIGSIDGAGSLISVGESLMACLKCPGEPAEFRQFVLRNLIQSPGVFKLLVWNNNTFTWETVSVNSEFTYTISEKEYTFQSTSMGDYFDETNNMYLIYERTAAISTDFAITQTVQGYNDTAEVSVINTSCHVDTLATGSYFNLYSAGDATKYYVWFDANGDGTTDDPNVPGSTGIQINVSAMTPPYNDNEIAQAIYNKLITNGDFMTQIMGNIITVTNSTIGETTNISDNDSGLLVSTLVEGRSDTKEEVTINTAGQTGSLSGGEYFIINSANDADKYYFWIDTNGDGVTLKPEPPVEGAINVPINVSALALPDDTGVANAILTSFNTLPAVFSASVLQCH